MRKRFLSAVLLLILLVCSSAYGETIEQSTSSFRDHITDVMVKSGIAPGYEELTSLTVRDNYVVTAIASEGKNMLVIVENIDGEWVVTIANDAALYKNNPLEIVRHSEGGWRYDGFTIYYSTAVGQWAYFSFDRLGYGEWELGSYILRNGDSIWRIDRDYDKNDHWVLASSDAGRPESFDARAPFEKNLIGFVASSVPTSLEGARIMIGDAIYSLPEDNARLIALPTPSPMPTWPPVSMMATAQNINALPSPTEPPMTAITPDLSPLQGTEIEFAPNGLYAVYSGPGTGYVRGDMGKACVSTNGPITVYGIEDGYALIHYTTNDNHVRYGYIDAKYLPVQAQVEELAFQPNPVLLYGNTHIADSPGQSDRITAVITSNRQSSFLAAFGIWSYIETTNDDGTPLRGFVIDEHLQYMGNAADPSLAAAPHPATILQLSADPAEQPDIDQPVVFTVITNKETTKLRLVNRDWDVLYQSLEEEYMDTAEGRIWRLYIYFAAPYEGIVIAVAGNEAGWNESITGNIPVKIGI